MFEVDSSGVPGCVQVLTVAPNTAGSNLLCYPSSSNCSYFGDTSGGIPATVINTISNQHWFVAGTDLLPVDAKFATYRMLAPCGQQIWRQPFDQQLRGTYGLGYQSSAPGVGVRCRVSTARLPLRLWTSTLWEMIPLPGSQCRPTVLQPSAHNPSLSSSAPRVEPASARRQTFRGTC